MGTALPLSDHILVLPEEIKEEEAVVEGSLAKVGFIVKKDKEAIKEIKSRLNKGTVVAIGPDISPFGIKVGDAILIYPFAKNELILKDKIYWMVREEDCAMVWKEDVQQA